MLDPRPETETMVEAALAAFAARRGEALRMLDFGVGSGALLCALLSEFPPRRGLGVDLSEGAAAVARANVAALGLASARRSPRRATGARGSTARSTSSSPIRPISAAATSPACREVRDHDPRLALDGGADGLDAYRALAPRNRAAARAARGGSLSEIGAGQGDDVAALSPRGRARGHASGGAISPGSSGSIGGRLARRSALSARQAAPQLQPHPETRAL